MALTLNDLQSLINGRIVENSTQEISASDLNELLHELLEYANEHAIADSRISANIARVAAMNAAIQTAKDAVKAELIGTAPAAGDTLGELYNMIQTLTSSTPPSPIPVGVICMWSGTVFPPGWALCNGTNGTPDLRGRFIVGYVPGAGDYSQPGNLSELKYSGISGTQYVGNTGGSPTHTLEKEHIPTHHHLAKGDGATINITSSGSHGHTTNGAIKDLDQVSGAGSGKDVNDWIGGTAYANAESHTHGNTSFAGIVGNGLSDGLKTSPTPINHRPPYYTLAYIMKIS